MKKAFLVSLSLIMIALAIVIQMIGRFESDYHRYLVAIKMTMAPIAMLAIIHFIHKHKKEV